MIRIKVFVYVFPTDKKPFNFTYAIAMWFLACPRNVKECWMLSRALAYFGVSSSSSTAVLCVSEKKQSTCFSSTSVNTSSWVPERWLASEQPSKLNFPNRLFGLDMPSGRVRAPLYSQLPPPMPPVAIIHLMAWRHLETLTNFTTWPQVWMEYSEHLAMKF